MMKEQKHWIGKSTGAEVNFKVKGSDIKFDVFTTRVDTLNGVTYVVLAPEYPLVDELTTADNKAAVEEYKEAAKKQSDIERQSLTREKTGVFTGSYAINPINGKEVPVWVGDYVLATYGTGAVMAVPAHDERDFAFATKFNLPIDQVITSKKGGEVELPYCEYGVLINSGEFDGLTTEQAKEAIVEKLAKDGVGSAKVNYRLRDWLVSRQRYWGAPIPIIYCEDCGAVPVPEKDLPVELPYNVEFAPDGKSPLAKCEEFINTTCPCCGKPAKRECDTLDTFVCSSWYQMRYVDNKNTEIAFDKEKVDKMLPVDKYVGGPEHACMHLLYARFITKAWYYLRYPDNKNGKEAFDPAIINKMLPVDKYVGGPEHACMHLLYARFITKALRDMGYLSFDEPFKSLTHQGLILGPDGLKMSKSKGNTISPDDYIQEYGADVFRMYLMFGFAYVEGGAWSDDGIKSVARFVDRIERYLTICREAIEAGTNNKDTMDKAEKELNFWLNNAIKGVTEDADKMQFNTAIARMMEFINALSKYVQEETKNLAFLRTVCESFIKILSPFAPHFAEEQWSLLTGKYSVFNEAWPTFDPKALDKDEIEIAIQVNGKIKNRINVASDLNEEGIKAAALANEAIVAATEGKTIVKVEIAIQVNGKIKNRINVASDLNEEGIKAAALANEAIVAATEGKTIVKVIVIKGRLVNIVVR